jgi:hypothetical protein
MTNGHIIQIFIIWDSVTGTLGKKVAIKYLEEIDNVYNKTKKLNPKL